MKTQFPLLKSCLVFMFFAGLFISPPYSSALALSLTAPRSDLSAQLHLLTQLQFFYRTNEGPQGNDLSFQLRRIRPGLSGEYAPYNLKYNLVLEAGSTSTQSNVRALDAHLTYQINGDHRLRLGQYRILFGAEFSHSGGKQEFVDRSIIADNFGLGRDIGLELSSSYSGTQLHSSIFVVNGDGINTVSGDTSILAGAAFAYDVMGTYQASMSDIDRASGASLRLNGGVAYDFGNANVNGNKLFRAFVNGIYRNAGWYAIAEGQWVRNTGIEENQFGALAQLSYLIQEQWVAGVRAAANFVDDVAAVSTDTESSYEMSAVINWYIDGHDFKIQSDYSLLLNANAVNDRTDHRLRTQVQFSF